MTVKTESITSSFWGEIAEDDNPFVARRCICAGYDVFGDLLPNANLTEYLYVLFKREQPNVQQRQLLDAVAIALANPGPRDYSVRAAMSAGAGGSTMASSLIAALSVGAGNFGGSRELFKLLNLFTEFGTNTDRWRQFIDSELRRIATEQADTTDRNNTADKTNIPDDEISLASDELQDVWLPMEHIAGFDPWSRQLSTPMQQCLQYFCECGPFQHLKWLQTQLGELQNQVGRSIALTFITAAAFCDLNLDPEFGEMLYLLLRLPGAAAHALEQRERGWQQFPFHGQSLKVLEDDSPPSPCDKEISV